MFADTSVQITSDYSTPAVLGLVIFGAIIVALFFFGQNAIASGRSRLRAGMSLWEAHDAGRAARRRGRRPTVQTNPFKDPRERREALRRGGQPVGAFVSYTVTDIAPVPAVVIDRSTGGLCLSVPAPAELGKLLSVRPADSPDTFPWLTVEVRHCRQQEDRWFLGCKFQRKLPWGELLQFG